ncbi:hypothetical protein S83_019325 [Arachis hypogaea]
MEINQEVDSDKMGLQDVASDDMHTEPPLIKNATHAETEHVSGAGAEMQKNLEDRCGQLLLAKAGTQEVKARGLDGGKSAVGVATNGEKERCQGRHEMGPNAEPREAHLIYSRSKEMGRMRVVTEGLG